MSRRPSDDWFDENREDDDDDDGDVPSTATPESEDDPFALPAPVRTAGRRRQRDEDVRPTPPTPSTPRSQSTSSSRSSVGRYSNGRLQRVRFWVFTVYDEPWASQGMPLNHLPEDILYVCGQPEYNTTEVVDELTGDRVLRQHFQGYVQTVVGKPMTLDEVRDKLGLTNAKCFFTPAGSTRPQSAIFYTKKEKSAVKKEGASMWKELGTPDASSTKDQFDLLVAACREPGMTYAKIVERFPSQSVRYHAAIEKMLRTFSIPKDRTHCDVYFFFGPTGTGKTHSIRNLERDFEQRVYVKPRDKWFCGYEDQPVLLLDDWRDTILPLDYMLLLLQKFAMRVEIKGGMRPAAWTTVYITSNKPLDKWYPNADKLSREAFMARIPEKNRVTFYERIDKPFCSVAQLSIAQRRAQLEAEEAILRGERHPPGPDVKAETDEERDAQIRSEQRPKRTFNLQEIINYVNEP